MKNILLVLALILQLTTANAANTLQAADANFASYLPLLANQRVAIFTNNASQVDGQNIVKVLLQHNVNIVKIFSPEHGFSGLSDAGTKVANSEESNLQIISLYGKKDQPSAQDLNNVDVIVFDIQDVGVRYYTYISSLQKLMEAATNNHKPLIILDRPNPNASYIDGPILEAKYKSFVGMQAIPIVYGMTIGEYAKMLVGEKWLDLMPKSKASQLKLTIIPMLNYTHASKYQIDIRPSPNLPNMAAIYWYPSLGWFEGTQLSVGRGTEMPFQVLGYPGFKSEFSFKPQPSTGALNPPLNGQICHGWNLQMSESAVFLQINGQIQLRYLIDSYQQFPNKSKFFTPFFAKLAGTDSLRQQIIAGTSESEIRRSWQKGLQQFKLIRIKYLLYPES
ncbi:MAG: hypothetical protein QG651_185 [Pseudomonadota bacterium]|jgi:uncharacterized protein YbbC (DUF1343 family)|nr:hypothetical protein [Pseudomonadota bacterium]